MKREPSGYRAYLLRLWRIEDGEKAIWRASLQDVRTGQRLGFADLDEAIAHLRKEIRSAPDTKRSREE
jgi:hypothetical protein